MSGDNRNLTASIERREHELRRAIVAAATERPVTPDDIRPGTRADIAAAVMAHGRIRVCPRPDQVQAVAAAAPANGWKKAALTMAASRASDWAISKALGVPQQAVRNFLSAERKRAFRKRQSKKGASMEGGL